MYINYKQNYYVYITVNQRFTVYYIGFTNNITKRIQQHKNKTFKGFTAKYNVDVLVYYEHFYDVNEAIDREKQLKKWSRNKKVELIKQHNPEFKDLSVDLI